MTLTLDANQSKVFNYIGDKFKILIENSLQTLLNTKHLYQSINIPFPDSETVYKEIAPELIEAQYDLKTIKPLYIQLFEISKKVSWGIINPNRRLPSFFKGNPNMRSIPSIEISPKTIKCFCHTCDDIEPYNFVCGGDVIHDPIDDPLDVQVFTLTYECQGCKSDPEVFMVRRKGTKITLCGRSPIEEVMVPKYLPKDQKYFISFAIVANNSGQTLSGIFQLRIFIEQYVRCKSSDPQTDNIDFLFKEYASSLPQDFKDKFPSLKDIYSSLSVCIHFADPNEEVFEKAKNDIYKHFDAKRVHDIGN